MKKNQLLDSRLMMVYKMIDDCNVVCDIGSDHGYLPIYCLINGKANTAVITDINKGPLDNSRRTAAKYNMEERCSFYLGDGIAPVRDVDPINEISICGMGGEMMCHIISNDMEKAKSVDKLILQPMKNFDILLEFLNENGFEILDEDFCDDGIHYYYCVSTRYTGEVEKKDDFEFIEKLVNVKNESYLRYLKVRLEKEEKILENIRTNAGEGSDSFKNSSVKIDRLKKIIERF